MTKTYTRRGQTHPWSVADAVAMSLTEDVSYGDHDSDFDRLRRQCDAQARAIGELAALLVKIAPACAASDVDACLNELVSYRFAPVEAAA
jgi:hypothetical protein